MKTKPKFPWLSSHRRGHYYPRDPPLDLDDPALYSTTIEQYEDFQNETLFEIKEKIARGHIFSTPETYSEERALLSLVPLPRVAASEFGKTPPRPKWRRHKRPEIKKKETTTLPEIQFPVPPKSFRDYLMAAMIEMLKTNESGSQ